MSRAFVNEDADADKAPRFVLPKKDDPGYDEAAAWALLEGADMGDSRSAELATGYRWGEPRLHEHVAKIQHRAERQGDERLVALTKRFIRS